FDADGRFDYTAATVFTGPDSFSLTASDGARESTPLAVPIEIVPAVDDPPECNVLLAAAPDAAGAYLVAGDRPVRGRIACTDDTPTAELTFALLSAPAHGTLSALTKESATSASFLYAPATGHRGADAFAFTIDDGVHGPRASGGTVRVVEPDTSAPRCSGRLHTPITADRYEVERGETVRGTISCLDLDGDELAFSVALLPTRGSLSALDTQRDSASFTYTAGADEGADRVELVAGDGTRSSNAVTLVIDVVEPYDAPPTCDIGLFTTPFASAAYPAQNRRPNPGIVSCVDDEGDPLEFTVAAPPQHGELAQFAPAHGFATFAYRAQGAYVGADAATVRVRDGAGGEETVTLMLDVHPSANGAPRCTVTLAAPLAGGVYELAAGVSADGQIACEDPDSDDLTIAIAEAPTRGALSVLAGGGSIREFSFSAGASAAGADRFVVRAVDALGAVTNVAVLLRIAAPATEPGERDPGPGDGGRGPGDGGPLPSPPLQPPGGSGAPGTPPETVPSRPPLPPSARALPPASLAGLRLAPMRKSRGLRLTFTAVPSQAIGVVVRTRLKRKLIVVGRATRRYARGGTQTLDVKLAPAGLRELKRRGSLALTVDITTRATGRAEARLTRKLLLRTSR
ncbi:MAG TPA: hypothetical protein VLK58_07425, partial [Conexibacter sp.]|nr:hypothetical protein [Conexibacter sp.]